VGKIQYKIELPESVSAPVRIGDEVGKVVFTLEGNEIGKMPIYAAADVERLGFFGLWCRVLGKFLLK
jgi:D-alanyl-D-alanine carboxypeptidase (penicillin-binding protein 5/6)